MRLLDFKNRVLFCFLLLIACGSKSNNESAKVYSIPKQNPSKTNTKIQEEKPIIVAANQTQEYLPLLKGKRVGIVANQTSVIFKQEEIATSSNAPRNNNYLHLVDSLISLKINIKKVFAPEHGFRGKADAGEHVKDGVDTKTQLPIFSLHGKYKKPTSDQLKDLDIMIFDIQDVGVRFYTYISTLHYVMEACAENNVPLIILDRPNPNGNYVDGPTLKKEHSSFLGMHPIPLVHGMTIGEYAHMINGEKWLANGMACNITVIPVKNYTHSSTYWLHIRPSPNLPNDHSITLYPSLGLFEGTNINAGRGTEFQFQRYGAPFLDKKHYDFNYTPVSNFGAKYPKHKGEICYGMDLSKIKAERMFTLKYIIDAYTHSTDKSKFFVTKNFTTHAGTEELQKQIESGMTEEEIKASWQEELNSFKALRKQYLLYN